jgi:cyclopropane fatty-acyl-phospholipid synthase-like methyltransferase
VLEFGCGLGTTSSFLARHVPGGTKVVCIEPEHIARVLASCSSRASMRQDVRALFDQET